MHYSGQRKLKMSEVFKAPAPANKKNVRCVRQALSPPPPPSCSSTPDVPLDLPLNVPGPGLLPLAPGESMINAYAHVNENVSGIEQLRRLRYGARRGHRRRNQTKLVNLETLISIRTEALQEKLAEEHGRQLLVGSALDNLANTVNGIVKTLQDLESRMACERKLETAAAVEALQNGDNSKETMPDNFDV